MTNDKDEYIVKAKKVNLEVNGPQYDFKDRISYYVILGGTVILCLFLSKILIAFIIICLGLLLKIFSYSKWNLRIEDETIYIKKDFRKYIIDYKDLINVMSKKSQSAYDGSVSVHHYLEIEYSKNNHCDIVNLPFSPKNMETEVSEICRLFITNKQLERYPENYNDYIDIK